MAISELQNIRNELARIRSGGASQSPTAEAQTDLKNSEKNTGNGVGYTLGKLWGGIVRSHEGWFDAAIAQAADVFGNDELAERVMKNDWMDYGKYDASFNPGKGWEFTGDVASGVGNMLPAIALSFVPFAGAGLSQGWFMQSASGQAVSDAVKETGELGNKEWAYGTASGLLEGAIEKISGGIGGTSVAKGVGKKLGKTTLGKLAVNAVGEGGEEVASDILDPFLRKITGMSDTYEAPTLDELGRTFAVGSTTGTVMGGASRGIQAVNAGGFNNLNAAEDTQELTERQADNNLRQTEGKKAIYTEEDINRTKESLSKRLQKMDDTTRVEFLKRNARVAQMFNEDGTVKDFAPSAEAYNEGTYSASLKGREGSFAYKPVADTSAISQEAKQVMNTLTKITGGNTNIVLTEDALTTESGKTANGLYQDGVIYLNAKATDYDKALTVGVHEVVHGLEGTKEYNELAKYISQQIKNDPDLAQRYNIDAYRNAYDKLLKGEWTESTKDYQAATEIFADYIGNVVAGNKTLLNNLVARNSNVFVRFLNWVRNSIAKLGESAEERKMRKDLQTLEKMLVEALQAGNGGISLEEVEELSKSAEKRLKTQDGNVQSVKFGENKNADGKLATARYNVDTNVFEIGKDSELAQRIANSDKSKYTVIKEYLVEKFGNTKFTLSDGKKAIMDNSDAEKLKYNADNLKVAELSNLKNLVEKAEYIGDPKNVTHRKFDAFSYYKITVSYDGNKFDILINVGRAKNDGVYHIYTITKYNEKGAVGLLKNNPSGPVGNRIKDGSFDSIITEKTDLSSENEKKVEKTSTSRKSIDVNEANKQLPKEGTVRFSVELDGKSVAGDGEVTKNLVALHNLSESNLLRVIKLGGFPMPSIAVTTTELPHENYGDITVVFGRETIDPESDSRNVVYDRDAWTPTMPTVDVKLSNQKVDSLIKNLQGDVGDNSTYKRSIFSFFDGKYRDNNGDYVVPEYDYTREQFGERAIKNSGIVAAYLSEKGVKVEPVYTERGFTMGWASFTRKEAADLFDFVGITEDVTRDNATQEQRDAILEKYIEYQAKKKLSLFRRFNKNPNLTVEDAVESIRKDYDDGNVSQLFFMAEDFFNKNRPKDIYDEQATIDKMQDAITDKQDFYNWFWDKIEATFEKKGIDNDSDVFDRRGNRRSFEQRHFAYTASNIVKAMAKGEQEGKAGFGITAGSLAAKLSKRFESIEDIHEAKEYLALVSEDDLKAFNDKTYELYDELVTAIAGKSSDFLSDSHRRDDVGDILGKCAGAKPLTVENIKRIFDRETRGYNLGYKFNNDIAEQTLLLFESLKHIPTTYFESKPRRVVALNEIKNVLIPQGASENLVKALKAKHIPYTEYNEWESRSSIIKNMDNARFSIDVDLDNKTTERVQTVVQDKKKRSVQEVYDDVVQKLKEGYTDRWIRTQISLTDEQAGILLAGRNVGVVLNGEVQRARSAKASATNMLTNEQRDFSGKNRVGDSLKSIFEPIHKKGEEYTKKFNLYLLHKLNEDRMSAVAKAKSQIDKLYKVNTNLKTVVEADYATENEWRKAVTAEQGGKEYLRLIEAENKPVFEQDVTAEFSKEKVAQLEKTHPEFKGYAEKVWKYSQNLLQYRVDAGLITQEQADQMTKMYPHYVPAFYENTKNGTSGATLGKSGIAVRTGIRSAKGSKGVAEIKDISQSLSKQTMAVVRAATINKVAAKLYEGAEKANYFADVEVASRESIEDPDVDYDKELPKDNQVFYYKDGERITLNVTEYVFAGFEGLTSKAQFNIPLINFAEKAIDLFKKGVTSYNPTFMVTNAIRDMWEALFYTKYGSVKFLAKYGKSFFRRNNPKLKELWQQYVALGGTGSGYYNNNTGIYDDRNLVKKGIAKALGVIDIMNNYVEQTPRFAEFVASVEAGNSIEQALYDSAEVTTNFSRGGRLTKKLNRCLIPFLNPSVQGWSKLWRSYAAPMEKLTENEIRNASKSAQKRMLLSRYGSLILKTLTVGITVGLFNDLLYRFIDEDEDYKNIPLNIKENYFLIKVGKKFLKIPKGRVMALYGSVATRITEYNNGNEDALNAWDWYKSASSMVSPLESASRTILAPLYDVQTNTTWYGGQIENASMENLAPSERYDEGTSKIAIAMGKTLNYSPKKIHYLLDQYSGVLGDFILPKTTNKAEKGMLSARFVVDPLYNSDVSTKYYDYKEELTFAKNSGDTNAKLMLKYMNEVQDALSKMYQQKRDIANDKSLSDKEKREQTEILQGLINATLSSSVDMADEFEQLLINSGFEQAVGILGNNATYKKMDEKAQNSAYNKLTEYYYEACLANLNGAKLGTKYTLYGAINATDIVVYLTEIGNIESDKDKKGNTIQGSRKEKVQKYIQGLKLTAQQKYILSYLAGYSPTDNGKSAISKYLKNNGYTPKEVNNLWKD